MQGQPTVPEASYDEYQKQLLEELLQHFETGDSRLRFAHVCLHNAVIAAIPPLGCVPGRRSQERVFACEPISTLVFSCVILKTGAAYRQPA